MLFDFSAGESNYHCSFVIDAKAHIVSYGDLLKLKLRKNNLTSNNQGACDREKEQHLCASIIEIDKFFFDDIYFDAITVPSKRVLRSAMLLYCTVDLTFSSTWEIRHWRTAKHERLYYDTNLV